MTDTDGCSHCSAAGRIEFLRHGRKLEYVTIGWNMMEAAVAIGGGGLPGALPLQASVSGDSS
jgi:hypothetical protein